jgi:hypothetical protein
MIRVQTENQINIRVFRLSLDRDSPLVCRASVDSPEKSKLKYLRIIDDIQDLL